MSYMCVNVSGSTVVTLVMYFDNTQFIGNIEGLVFILYYKIDRDPPLDDPISWKSHPMMLRIYVKNELPSCFHPNNHEHANFSFLSLIYFKPKVTK